MKRSWATFLLGPPIADRKEREERIGPIRGVGLLGLDALSSAAYGPEALLTALIALGALAARWVLPLSLAIVVVLLLVSFSYRQTVGAYPRGGGSYTVARENFGPRAGVLAAAALSLDYVLNVSVGIAAGVGALVSAVPTLLPWTLWICLGVLFVLTVVNLRGVRSTGAALVFPTYLFVACLFATLVIGSVRAVAEGGHPTPVTPPPLFASAAVESATVWMLLRGFANGCTAMTGIEAVSNSVPIFREPSVVGARRTLLTITVLLVLLLVGVAVLCRVYGITATPPGRAGYQSVLSQAAGAVFGRGAVYGVVIGSIVVVLALSANTSFAGLPRLYQLLAIDSYLPEPFMHQGRRLVFTEGIVVLSVLSAILLVVFGGVTNRLIPLFAVGALASFTISQAGMVVHWRRRRAERLSRARLVMNAAGAGATGITLAIVIIAKFVEGAWVSVVVVGGLYWIFMRMHRYYDGIGRKRAVGGPPDLRPLAPPHAIVPIRRWDRAAERALRFAVTLSPDVSVLQVLTSDRREDDLSARWPELIEHPAREAGVPPPKLVVLDSEFRQLYEPIIDYVRRVEDVDARRQVAVIVPQMVAPRWYHALLHTNAAPLLKTLLTVRGGPRIVVISAPWHLGDEDELLSVRRRWSTLPFRRFSRSTRRQGA